MIFLKQIMLEPDNDRLEEFFRKAAGKADVTFNEEDWKKLEARLDESEGGAGSKKATTKMTSAIVIGSLLLFTALVLLNMRYEIIGYPAAKPASDIRASDRNSESNTPIIEVPDEVPQAENDAPVVNENSPSDKNAVAGSPERSNLQSPEGQAADEKSESDRGSVRENSEAGQSPFDGGDEAVNNFVQSRSSDPKDTDLDYNAIPENDINEGDGFSTSKVTAERTLRSLDRERIYDQLIRITPVIRIAPAIAGRRNEQKADVMLPGAEEVDTGKAETTVKEEHASEIEHVATPRLSLLLSFAPDFSSTSNHYATPGKAYGAVIHYHLMRRWSISAGVIKNNKVYTGAGEDYSPPKGYWKYYTNGIVPASIDGACDILEFPVMIQYTIAHYGKNKWLVGAGASSYLMQSESYRYNFEEPNPGAKEGWDSNRSSRFLFNMVNFTVAYERQLLPGLMAGIEPYVKIPVEEIGWSNVRLFSAGASVTLRYKIIGRNAKSVPVRTRGPDLKK